MFENNIILLFEKPLHCVASLKLMLQEIDKYSVKRSVNLAHVRRKSLSTKLTATQYLTAYTSSVNAVTC